MVDLPLRSITFVNVGREMQSWTDRLQPRDTTIIRAIRLSQALPTQDISLEWDDSGMGGNIVVAGEGAVGRFLVRIAEEAKP